MTHCASIRPAWTPLNIALMVMGFVLFWPLGLAMLAYIMWGDRFQDMARDARDQFRGPMRSMNRVYEGYANTGNVAFDEYRAREMKRLEEERRKLDEMRTEFDDFLRNLRRAKDQEEFDRFMRSHNDESQSKA